MSKMHFNDDQRVLINANDLSELLSALEGKSLSTCSGDTIQAHEKVKKELEICEDKIQIVWSIEEVHAMADDILTDEQARKVLALVVRSHDCNYGVTWESIESAIDMIKEEVES